MEILKLITYFLIFATSTTIGVIYSNRYKKRVTELKEFKTALNMLKTKIRFTLSPLRESFLEISKNVQSKTKVVFENAYKLMENENATESWNRAINETELSLTKEDKEILSQFGKLLGKTDIYGQLNEIDLCLNFIDTQIDKAEDESKRNTKLYKSLGLVTGIGLIIILF